MNLTTQTINIMTYSELKSELAAVELKISVLQATFNKTPNKITAKALSDVKNNEKESILKQLRMHTAWVVESNAGFTNRMQKLVSEHTGALISDNNLKSNRFGY